MNDADLILGKKKHVDMPAAKRSPFARYPDVQELCDTFMDEMGWNTDPYTIKQIAAGARDFKRAIGNDPKLLLKTIQRMKRDKLTIASPRSCITIARRTEPDPDSEASRQRYVTGEFADFWEDDDE